MHEIITLQLGRQSNYVATHFWNAQESYFTYGPDAAPSPVDHDIHWRAGIGADGTETYLPRTVVYDRKSGFGALRQVNALYEAAQENGKDDGAGGGSSSSSRSRQRALWDAGSVVVHRAAPILPSAYTQSLDAGLPQAAPLTPAAVRYWSDYSRVYYHPRSLIAVGDEDPAGPRADNPADGGLGPETATATNGFAAGEALFTRLDREHDLLDRDLRPFVEEADHMQGVQVLASVDDAWGGFAARYLERMRDEYGKAPIWLWALQEPVARLPREQRLYRLANKARTLAEAHSQASLVVPLALPPLPSPTLQATFDPLSAWHTSALLATAFESATLPARLRAGGGGDSLAYLTELLNATGKQTVANLQMSVAQSWRQIERQAAAAAAAGGGGGGGGGGDQDSDYRIGGGSGHGSNGNSRAVTALQLDLDFAPRDEGSGALAVLNNGARHGAQRRKTRMFGQAVVIRTTNTNSNSGGDRDGDGDEERATDPDTTVDRHDMVRRRFALQPVSQRYHVHLGFPLLDSFPFVYQGTAPSAAAVPVTTALATDSAVAARLRMLRTAVASPRTIAVEDRETLGNELAGLADAYHEGWSSGSDEGDDDE
ncbi:mtDNA inheritance protein [Niveomyces insectorum RCEF 264]|uniref:MtDNA inheritance protein n=1 Tax=Niveomyces insectorum RCEF 264 TaxID=1081102 RepID=A0A162MRT1_9HYPO|nr:mtDNA inheritance protein [Niveomyces insectorum RCEF 264]